MADFEQAPWAIARGFDYKWWILVSAGNRSKLPETPPTCLQIDSNWISGEFARVRILADFEQKPWAIARGFDYKWWILVSAGNRSKLPETPPTCLQIDSNWISGEFARVRILADFEQKPWAIARGFDYKWWILVSAGNRSKLPETPPTCLQIDSNGL